MPLAPATEPLQALDRRVAIQALARIAGFWGLQRQHLPALLARAPRTVRSWYERDSAEPLDQDVLERISHIIGIYDGLHRLFGDAAYADRWVNEPNVAFGAAPRALLLTGSFTQLVRIRNYIEAALQR
jgi:uncharacterized protein (DUF2384 family)